MRELIAAPFSFEEDGIDIGISIGQADWTRGIDPLAWINMADAALYDDKRRRRSISKDAAMV